MRTDVSLGGFLLTREEWDSLDDDARLMLLHAVVGPSLGGEVADEYYESYELDIEKLAS